MVLLDGVRVGNDDMFVKRYIMYIEFYVMEV